MNKFYEAIRFRYNKVNMWFNKHWLTLALALYSIFMTWSAIQSRPITIIIDNNTDEKQIITTVDEGRIVEDEIKIPDIDLVPIKSEPVVDDRFDEEPIESSVSYLMLSKDHNLSEWDLLRKHTYKLAGNFKLNYPDVPVDQLYIYDALMKVFYVECKYKVGDGAINNITDARGIIQWMPKTRKKLSVPNDIHTWPLYKQLPHVENYLMYKIRSHKIKTRKLNDFIDFYMIVLFPRAADKHMDYKIFDEKCKERCGKFRSGKKWCAYHANSGYDANKSGRVTKREIRTYILTKHFQKQYQ